MLKIGKSTVEQIFSQAEAGLPYEVCGYLLGNDGLVVKHVEMTNIDQSHEHFTMDAKEQFAVMREARNQNLSVLAVYHSHPETPARPSGEDIRLAFDPQISYVIVSMLKERDIKSFKIRNGEVQPEELLIMQEQS